MSVISQSFSFLLHSCAMRIENFLNWSLKKKKKKKLNKSMRYIM